MISQTWAGQGELVDGWLVKPLECRESLVQSPYTVSSMALGMWQAFTKIFT